MPYRCIEYELEVQRMIDEGGGVFQDFSKNKQKEQVNQDKYCKKDK